MARYGRNKAKAPISPPFFPIVGVLKYLADQLNGLISDKVTMGVFMIISFLSCPKLIPELFLGLSSVFFHVHRALGLVRLRSALPAGFVSAGAAAAVANAFTVKAKAL